jgi:two-component system, response regulator
MEARARAFAGGPMKRDERYVLYVEDNPGDVELTQIAFKEGGFPYQVEVVYDGAEALDYLFGKGKYDGRDKTHTPALILLDLNLPKIHGLEVLSALRADPITKHVFVVILTGSDLERDRTEAKLRGANLYIRKPLDYEEVIKMTRRIENLLSALGPHR